MTSPAPTTPTADLYFARAHAAELARGRMADGSPIRRHGASVLALGDPPDRWVVLRDASPETVRRILRTKPRALAVVVDDDADAIARDPSQPLPYRWRQWLLARRVAPLFGAATHALAPSRSLLERLRGKAPNATVMAIDPALPNRLLPALDHHDATEPLTLLLSDTRSHLADIADAAPAIRAVLDANPTVRLVTYLGARAPVALRHARAEHREPLPWHEFEREAASQRAHILLAPRRSTAVNAARSATRLLDAAAAGAVGLYGRVPAIADAAAGDLPSWTHGNVDWAAALQRLIDDGDERKRLATRTAALATRIGDIERQRTVWTTILS